MAEKLRVNGHDHQLDVPVGRTLAEALREDLGLTGTKVACGLCLGQRLRCDGGDRRALVLGVCADALHVAGPDGGQDARRREGRREIDPLHPRPCVRAAKKRGVGEPGQADVAGVTGLAARLLVAVDADGRAADDSARPRRPLVERVLLDERPDLLVAALDLLLRLDQPRQVVIASSIRG